jgi:protein-S-isoprenylcysteine O-methyltransferase Ste14
MSIHKNIFHTSDFICYSTIVLALILEWFFPTEIGINAILSVSTGILLSILAWTIIFTAKYQFKKHNQKSGPNNETTLLIQKGLFAHTRNPIYVGVVLISPALGLIIGSIWLLLDTIPIFLLIQHFLIIPEENYLKAKFGDAYTEYCATVRRWV